MAGLKVGPVIIEAGADEDKLVRFEVSIRHGKQAEPVE